MRHHAFSLVRPRAEAPAHSCLSCQADLGAYTELCRDAGGRSAAERLPHVWWHLWTCEPCARLFAQECALAASGLAIRSIGSTAGLSTPAVQTLSLRVNPRLVARLIRSHAQFGIAYGSIDEMIIAEEQFGGSSFQVTMRPDGFSWAITVIAAPPIAVDIALQLDDRAWIQSLDEHGTTVFRGLDSDGLGQCVALAVILSPTPRL